VISFNAIPTALRIPFVAAEFDASNASRGNSALPYRGLILGQKASDGEADSFSLHRITSPDQLIALAGQRSMARRQAIAWRANNTTTELWAGIMPDPVGAAAEGTITVDDAEISVPNAQAAGTVHLYVGGEYVPVAVAAGDTAEEVATAIGAAINAEEALPVTAEVAGAVVTVTFANVGVIGNGYDLRVNYRDGEELPVGISVECVSLADGTGVPDLDSMIAALGDSWYQIWAHGWTDANSLESIETELLSRFGPMRMIDGVAVTAAAGSFGTLTALGETRNSPHSEIAAQPGEGPLTPSFEYAAEVAGLIALYGAVDPARPFQTLPLTHTKAIPEADRFTNEERNLLLYSGIATSRVGAGGVVQLERMITTYRENAAGAPDTAYLDVTTMLTLMYLRYDFRNLILTKYPRHKLADDGTRIGPGQAVITPKVGKAEAISWFRDKEEQGLVENFDQFKRDLVVERNESDPNRLDFLLPPDLINQLIVTAAQIQFRL
jgi:phage tail sheath gpL-like